MSLGKLNSLSEAMGRQMSKELPEEKVNRHQGDQDYVLVDDSEQGSDHQSSDGLMTPFDQSRSPTAVSVGLRAPSVQSNESESEGLGIPLHTKALAAFRNQHTEPEEESVDTARTEYSGLDDSSLPEVVERSEVLQHALDEANQQHQWAMEAVMRGWEAEKADLLGKLERVIEARDTLEEELKHSEHSFAGMLEGILDQKLDHMMHVLQESNLSRSFSGSQLSSPSSQSTFLNAHQVAADLGTMLDTMRTQQAAVEDRVTSMQSAVLQLVPETDTAKSGESAPGRSGGLHLVAVLRQKVGRPVVKAGHFMRHRAIFLRHKIPEAVNSTAQRTGVAARTTAAFIRYHVSQATDFCKDRVGTPHLQAIACVIAGFAVASIVASGRCKKSLPQIKAEPIPVESRAEEMEVLEVQPDVEDSVLDQSVEIILNKSGVFKRFGRAPDKTLVLAWPRISVEYN